MITVLLCWIVASFVFLAFADMLISAYNCFAKRNEEYNVCDRLMLGMFAVCGFLAISSIGFPSNQNMLIVFIIACLVYCILQKKRLSQYITYIGQYCKSLTNCQKALMAVAFLAFLFYSSWTMIGHDAAMYHFQMVRWSEEYPAIYGLANLEERFGFNSNYFLISAMFTFRFIFDQPLYCLQGLIGFYIMAWIIAQAARSNYSIISVLLLVIYTVFIYINTFGLRGTSSDIIPNMIVFYLFAKIILHPALLKKQFLFFLLVPVALATFKLSAAMFCLIAIYPIILIVKSKEYKPLIFVVCAATCIIVPWLMRNVIISGYLVFPLHTIDIFSFDWKVPSIFLEKEMEYINTNSRLIFYKLLATPDLNRPVRYSIVRCIHIATYALIVLSPLIVLISLFFKKNKIDPILYLTYFVLLVNIVFWFISAADPRFVNGALLITVFLVIHILIANIKMSPKLGATIAVLLIGYLFLDGLKWIKTYSTDWQSTLETIYKPKYDSEGEHTINQPIYSAYELNNSVTIYVTDDYHGKCYDLIPCIKPEDLSQFNFQDYKNLEARGNKIEDGFRYRNK